MTLMEELMFFLLVIQTFSLWPSALLWLKHNCSWFSRIRRYTVDHRDCIKLTEMAMGGAPPQAFADQDHKAHMETHLSIMSTPVVQMNPQVLAVLQGHIQEHIGMLAEQQATQMVMEQAGPEVQQNPEAAQMLQPAIARQAAMIIAELTEQYAQTVEPVAEGSDPLVEIRNQELQLKAADLQRKSDEFQARQQLDREQDAADMQLAQDRLNLQQDALADKTRVAEDRVQTQRDIAALNNQTREKGMNNVQ